MIIYYMECNKIVIIKGLKGFGGVMMKKRGVRIIACILAGVCMAGVPATSVSASTVKMSAGFFY